MNIKINHPIFQFANIKILVVEDTKSCSLHHSLFHPDKTVTLTKMTTEDVIKNMRDNKQLIIHYNNGGSQKQLETIREEATLYGVNIDFLTIKSLENQQNIKGLTTAIKICE